MSKTTTLVLGALALALMIVLPSLLMAKAMYDRANGTIWQISIEGYDPRDLLRGHYLNFTYDWNFKDDAAAECPYDGQSCCLCLNEAAAGSNVDPVATLVGCQSPEARQCTSKIIGKKGWNGIVSGNHPYFVPQEHALALETLLREGKNDFKMEIAVPRSGGPAIIRKLYIDQKPLEAFLTKNP
ncbi:MAG: GDYXXLXY domain-containing protein [Micavibrio sp.]